MDCNNRSLASLCCAIAVWFIAYFLNIITCKNALQKPHSNVNNTVFQFHLGKWVDLTMLQHLVGAVLAAMLAKVMSKSICSPAFDHKLVIGIAAVFNVIGNLAFNAAFTMVPSGVAHLVESCQPLLTLTMVIVSRKEVSMGISSFLSVSIIVLGVVAFPIVSSNFTTFGLAAAVISTIGFSTRNVLVKNLSVVWNDPLQKFLAVSAGSVLVVTPVWFIRIAITCIQSISSAGILKLTTTSILHSFYSIASFNVLENVLSPVSHAIIAILTRLLFYFEDFPMTFSWNYVISFLLVLIGMYFYDQQKLGCVWIKFTLVVSIIFMLQYHNIEHGFEHNFDGNLTDDEFAIIPIHKNTITKFNTTLENHDTISMAWVFERPINGNALSNIQTLAGQNPNMTVHVYCGTTQCVDEVTKLNLRNVAVEFAVISDIVKNTLLQEWLAYHPSNKVLAGRAFENHLQEVTILGILWKYGGFYVSPMVRMRSRLVRAKNHSCNISWVNTEKRLQNDLPSVFDVAYFCSNHPFVYELFNVYVLKYFAAKKRGDSFQFNFHDSVWKTVREKCYSDLPCPSFFKRNTIADRTPMSALETFSDHFGIADSPPNLSKELELLAILQYLPFVDTLLGGAKSSEQLNKGNVTALFDSNWGASGDSWPPPNNVDPIMLSVHVNNVTGKRWGEKIEVFTNRTPIGCQDSGTFNFMKEHRVDAFLSGSLTLLLNSPSDINRTRTEILVTDLERDILELLPRKIEQTATRVKEYELEAIGSVNRLQKVFRLKTRYEKAKLVITQHIDHALLCAALNTPVIFIAGSDGETTNKSTWHPLFHTLDHHEMTKKWSRSWLGNFSWHNIPPNPNLGTLMKFKASLWDVIRQNQILHNTARKLGVIPMSPLFVKNEDCLLFHLIFTTSSKSSIHLFTTKEVQPGNFNWRHMRTVESIFYHHPSSRIIVHSNTLSQDEFNVFTELGYSITVQAYNLKELLKGSPAESFISKLDKVSKGGFWYSHETDLIRLLVLYKYGGVYMDTDMILVRPLTSLKMNTLGFQEDSKNSEANGALMMFAKNNQYIQKCLVRFATNYKWDWAGNGPGLLTAVWKTMKEEKNDDVHVVSYKYFYMMSYKTIKGECFSETSGKRFTKNMEILKSEAYAVHLNSKNTGNLGLGDNKLIKGTIGSYVLNAFCILCNRIH